MAMAFVTLSDGELATLRAAAVKKQKTLSNLFRAAMRLPELRRGRRSPAQVGMDVAPRSRVNSQRRKM